MQLRHRLGALLLLAALATGCVTAAEPEQDVDTDAVTARESGPSTGQATAAEYIGLDARAALERAGENGVEARVGTAADVGEPGQTEDYEVGRLTFVVVDDIVTEVIVETDTGLERVAAS